MREPGFKRLRRPRMSSGVVYILRNSYIKGPTGTPLLKIGGSSRSGYERARELSSATGVPGSFEVLHEFATKNWRHLEAMAFSGLREYRRAGEFFEVDVERATSCIESIQARLQYVREAPERYRNSNSPAEVAVLPGVTFVSNQRNSVLDIYCDGLCVGELMSDTKSAEYVLYDSDSSREIIFADIFTVPGRGNRWSRTAVSRNAKLRAAWIAQIIQAFLRDGAITQYEVKLTRLPSCQVEVKHGLVELTADVNNYMRARIFRFNAAASASRASSWGHMFATVSMTALKWCCVVHVGYQELTFIFEAPVEIKHI